MESEPVLRNVSGDEEEIDTDLETDRLLGSGHQRLEDHGFYDDKVGNSANNLDGSVAFSLFQFGAELV